VYPVCFKGVSTGATTVTYILPSGCVATANINVISAPTSIAGNAAVCLGSVSSLASSPAGGTWTSSNTAVATVSSGGDVTGVSIGTARITYTIGSCFTTKTVSVNTAFGSGISVNMCLGTFKTINDSISGGTWSSSNPAVATINTTTGIAFGVSVGMTTLTHFFGSGCSRTTPLYVQNTVATIGGSSTVCVGSSATMSVPSSLSGGTWSVGSSAVASINSTTGVLTGVNAGTVLVSYTLIECVSTKIITVNPLPASISGTGFTCISSTTTLTNATTGGTWTSSTPAVAAVGSTTGVVAGISTGTSRISYTKLGCSRNVVVTVSSAPAAIVGSVNACTGSTIVLTCATPGGTWTSNNTSIATVGSGTVTGVAVGTAIISYGTGGSCFSTRTVTVNETPTTPSGESLVCAGQSIVLSCTPSPGTWSSSSTTIATANASTGLVTGVSSGTVNITYRTSAGCSSNKLVTVNPALPAITGGTSVCVGANIALNNAVAGGTWSSSSTSIATIASTTGIATGVVTGSSTITYTLSPGCYKTSPLLVNPAPASITGTSTTTVGTSVPQYCSTSGGAWSSSNSSVASIGTASGMLTGVSAGVVNISYTINTTGCYTTRLFTVNPVPFAREFATSDVQSNVFRMYPNPASSDVTIFVDVPGKMEIFTLEGKLVESMILKPGYTEFHMPLDLASGMYLCRFVDESRNIKYVRLEYIPK